MNYFDLAKKSPHFELTRYLVDLFIEVYHPPTGMFEYEHHCLGKKKEREREYEHHCFAVINANST